MLKAFSPIFDPSKLCATHLMGGREEGREGNDMLKRVKAVPFIKPLLN
jgi:hypothetical protein